MTFYGLLQARLLDQDCIFIKLPPFSVIQIYGSTVYSVNKRPHIRRQEIALLCPFSAERNERAQRKGMHLPFLAFDEGWPSYEARDPHAEATVTRIREETKDGRVGLLIRRC